MQVVCEATVTTDVKVKVAALQCLVKIMSLYYQVSDVARAICVTKFFEGRLEVNYT